MGNLFCSSTYVQTIQTNNTIKKIDDVIEFLNSSISETQKLIQVTKEAISSQEKSLFELLDSVSAECQKYDDLQMEDFQAIISKPDYYGLMSNFNTWKEYKEHLKQLERQHTLCINTKQRLSSTSRNYSFIRKFHTNVTSKLSNVNVSTEDMSKMMDAIHSGGDDLEDVTRQIQDEFSSMTHTEFQHDDSSLFDFFLQRNKNQVNHSLMSLPVVNESNTKLHVNQNVEKQSLLLPCAPDLETENDSHEKIEEEEDDDDDEQEKQNKEQKHRVYRADNNSSNSKQQENTSFYPKTKKNRSGDNDDQSNQPNDPLAVYSMTGPSSSLSSGTNKNKSVLSF